MAEIKKILVAEDELTNSILLKRILTKAGYMVVAAHNGVEAYKHMENETFDALLTDWMMPQMDGIELIRKVRQTIEDVPLIIMITALVSDGARQYALESGADDYIAKPLDVDELLTRVKDGLDRKQQEMPSRYNPVITNVTDIKPSFVGVVIATSTGGPPTLIETFKNLPEDTPAAFYIVQHGPPWMLETFAQRLQRETPLRVNLAIHNLQSEPCNIYIAPGDRHLRINPHDLRLQLDDGPKENYVRPAADPLFRSASAAFGKYCIAVILTGLGRDASQGAAQIASHQGLIIVQDPATAIAPSMPRTVIETGIVHRLVPLQSMSAEIIKAIAEMNELLK
jgi:two-component system, chemotaxis family, protein-glutamate methylesterase/glutaminase